MKNEEEVKNSVFGFGQSNDAFAKFFKGTSYLKPLAESKEAKTAVHNVSFESGCRNNWHMHTVPQILIAVELVKAGTKKKVSQLKRCFLEM